MAGCGGRKNRYRDKESRAPWPQTMSQRTGMNHLERQASNLGPRTAQGCKAKGHRRFKKGNKHGLGWVERFGMRHREKVETLPPQRKSMGWGIATRWVSRGQCLHGRTRPCKKQTGNRGFHYHTGCKQDWGMSIRN